MNSKLLHPNPSAVPYPHQHFACAHPVGLGLWLKLFQQRWWISKFSLLWHFQTLLLACVTTHLTLRVSLSNTYIQN